MQIWPAIDLRGGKCVRLKQGDYDRETIFDDDPVNAARRWVEAGAERLHLVDLDGARDGEFGNRDVVAAIVEAVDIPCQLGGGVRDEERIEQLLDLGLARLIVGTRAVTDPDWFRGAARRFPGKLAIGIDAREGQIATHGWLNTSDISAADFVRQLADEPLAAVIYTDIARDGMMAGPNMEATAEMIAASSHEVIASGGVTNAADVAQLARLGAAGCIVGRALYEGSLTIADAQSAALTCHGSS